MDCDDDGDGDVDVVVVVVGLFSLFTFSQLRGLDPGQKGSAGGSHGLGRITLL